MTIFIEDDQVLLVPPPGAAAVLSVAQARRLGRLLDQAASTTDRRVG